LPRANSKSVIEWSRDELYARLQAATSEVFIASPFLSAEVAHQVVLRTAASGAGRFRLLTCLSPAATSQGVLDPQGLLELAEAGWELRSGRNLHAKVSLVDRRWGLIGSGNLTVRGLGGEDVRASAELGVVLSRSQVREAEEIALRWWEEAESIGPEEIEKCPPRRRRQGRQRSAVGPDLGQKDALEGTPEQRSGIWLKMIYDRTETRGPEWWDSHGWVSDRHLLREGDRPILRPSYQEGDLLVLYVVGRGCPAIVEVTRAAEFEPERVREDPDAQPDDWKRWGWVTEVHCIHSVPVEQAPSLRDIGVASASVKRHGHIQLGPQQLARARAALLAQI